MQGCEGGYSSGHCLGFQINTGDTWSKENLEKVREISNFSRVRMGISSLVRTCGRTGPSLAPLTIFTVPVGGDSQ